MKTIRIEFLPASGIPPKVITHEAKVNVEQHTDDQNCPTYYRVYAGTETFLIPAANVAYVSMDLPPREL